MCKKSLLFSLLASLVVGTSLGIGVGRAYWLSATAEPSPTTTTVDVQEITGQPVAYFNNRYFASIEGAVTTANQLGQEVTVYVIPGSNPVIKKSFSIGNKVTLCLPYNDKDYYIKNSGWHGSYPDAIANPGTYLKNLVTVGDADHQNITISNNGKILIGGVLNAGSGNLPKNSHTAGDYAELRFYGNSSLVSNGTVECYGYITGDNSTGLIRFASSSTTKLVLTITEHRGGSTYYGMFKNLKAFPFNRWYFSGMRDVEYCFDGGANLYGYIVLYAYNGHYDANIMYISGTDGDGLVRLNSGAKLKGKFASATEINDIHIHGSFNLESLVMTLMGNSISTSGVDLPLTWYQHITLHPFENGSNANVTSSTQAVKLMPSSYLKICENVSATFAKLSVYDAGYTDAGINSSSYAADGHLEQAVCIVNGSLNTTYLGGIIQTEVAGATLRFSNYSSTSYELNSSTGSMTSTTVTYEACMWRTRGRRSEGGEYQNLTSTSTTYTSKGTYW